MRKRYFLLAATVLFFYFLGEAALGTAYIFVHSKVNGIGINELDSSPPQLWIEVHDISPGYGYAKLDEIITILENHKGAYAKAVLFVIPNHANTTPLRDYPEFMGKLKELEKRGYVIGMHGYAHPAPLKQFEFGGSAEEAEKLLEAGLEEFRMFGLQPRYFAPPGWETSREVNSLLRNNFEYSYYYFFIDARDETLPYKSHEYTWYTRSAEKALSDAKQDYSRSKGVFRLTLHMGAANDERALRFLDEFLGWVESRR